MKGLISRSQSRKVEMLSALRRLLKRGKDRSDLDLWNTRLVYEMNRGKREEGGEGCRRKEEKCNVYGWTKS